MLNTVRTAVVAKIATVSDIKVVVPGERYTPKIGTPWARLKMEDSKTEIAAIGGTYKKYTGNATIEVFYPSVSGTADMLSTVEDIADALDTQTITVGTDKLDIEYANVGDTLTGAAWQMTPIEVSYEMFA